MIIEKGCLWLGGSHFCSTKFGNAVRQIVIVMALSIAGLEAIGQRRMLNTEISLDDRYICRYPSATQIAKPDANLMTFSKDDLRIRLWAMGIIPTMKLPVGTTISISHLPSKHYVVQVPLSASDTYTRRCLTFNCADGALTSYATWFYPPRGMDFAKRLPSGSEHSRMRAMGTLLGLSISVERWRDSVMESVGLW